MILHRDLFHLLPQVIFVGEKKEIEDPKTLGRHHVEARCDQKYPKRTRADTSEKDPEKDLSRGKGRPNSQSRK